MKWKWVGHLGRHIDTIEGRSNQHNGDTFKGKRKDGQHKKKDDEEDEVKEIAGKK